MATQTAETDCVVSLGDDDLETVVEDSSVALVEFYTEWCGTCKRMKPVLEALAEDTDATILTIDIESNLERRSSSVPRARPRSSSSSTGNR